MLEPYAGKLARTVLRERGDGDIALLPGAEYVWGKPVTHHEIHRSHRIGWLRASVLGSNDGIVSTSSLIIGVAAANAAQSDIILAGLAGLVAGAMSMAAGEYVSVSSQSDTENADLELERKSLAENAEFEREELAKIYQQDEFRVVAVLKSDKGGKPTQLFALHTQHLIGKACEDD